MQCSISLNKKKKILFFSKICCFKSFLVTKYSKIVFSNKGNIDIKISQKYYYELKLFLRSSENQLHGQIFII